MIHLGYTSSGLDRSPAQRGDLHGGTLVNIVTALIILGLIGLLTPEELKVAVARTLASLK